MNCSITFRKWWRHDFWVNAYRTQNFPDILCIIYYILVVYKFVLRAKLHAWLFLIDKSSLLALNSSICRILAVCLSDYSITLPILQWYIAMRLVISVIIIYFEPCLNDRWISDTSLWVALMQYMKKHKLSHRQKDECEPELYKI